MCMRVCARARVCVNLYSSASLTRVRKWCFIKNYLLLLLYLQISLHTKCPYCLKTKNKTHTHAFSQSISMVRGGGNKIKTKRSRPKLHRERRVLQDYSSSVQCCFTSTETIRTISDGEPRTATSTFTQLLSSARALHGPSSMLLYVHRDHKDFY